MPRIEIRHSNRAGRTTGEAGFALIAALIWSVLTVGCGLDYGSGSDGRFDDCQDQVNTIPATVQLEVGRAAWVQVRDGPASVYPWSTAMCTNVTFETTPKVTLSSWRPGEVLITGVTSGQTSVKLQVAGSTVATIPVTIVAPTSGYPVVSVGGGNICALNEAGSLFCSGSSSYFPLKTQWPTRIPLIEPLAQVSLGCGTARSGKVYCWGQGEFGQGSPVIRAETPSQTPTLLPIGPARSVGVGESFGCALTVNGGVECWGQNYFGQLGVQRDSTESFKIRTVPTLENMSAIAVGASHACALGGDGKAWCWGLSGEGQLGTTQEDHACGFEYRCLPAPALVAGELHFAAIAAGRRHTCAIAVDGAAWCWGANSQGQLGTADLVDSREPRRAAMGFSFTALALGMFHTCGLTTDGAIYCWGRGKEGQLGDGTFTDVATTPVQVQSSVAFKSVSAGGVNSCAVPESGAAVCWGSGEFFQLGRGSDPTSAATPTRISGQP
jgi:alpha-tubulin suppressor-like RCC1 family protein